MVQISIILLIKNGAKHLEHAMRSLRRQNFDNFGLIVQDCLSNDNSLEIVKKYFPEAKIESVEDTGIGNAMNRAFRRCVGDIIGSIDCDNSMPAGTLNFVSTYFEKNQKSGHHLWKC